MLDLNDFSRVVFGSSTKTGTFCFICPFIFAGFDGNLQGSELIKFLKSHKFSKIKKNFFAYNKEVNVKTLNIIDFM